MYNNCTDKNVNPFKYSIMILFPVSVWMVQAQKAISEFMLNFCAN